MKNIYDIISNQKAIVDVKMAKYDLDYTVSHFNNNIQNYYIQEGLGDTLRSFGKKIIDFIKKIIEKIRQLVKNFINFFRGNSGSKNIESQLNKKIEQANKDNSPAPSGGGGGGGSTNKEEPVTSKEEPVTSKKESEPIKPGPHVKVDDLKDLLERSTKEVECKKFGPMRTRVEFVEKFANTFQKTFEESCEELEHSSKMPNVKLKMIEELFYGDEDDNLTDLLHQHFFDYDNETMKFIVCRRADFIYEYISKTYEVTRSFQSAEDEITKNLKTMIKMIESGEVRQFEEDDENVTDEQYQMMGSICQTYANLAGTMFSYLVQSTMRAYNICAGICVQITNDYCSKKFK